MDAVLFDLYDTFVWSRWGDLSDHVADRLGIDRLALHAAYDETRPARGIGTYGSAEGDMAAVVTAAGVDPDPALIGELTEYEHAFLLGDGITLYEDSLEVAAELRARGTKTALVSNCSHSTIPVVEHLGLAEVLDVLVLSVTAGVAKPDAGIYRAALDGARRRARGSGLRRRPGALLRRRGRARHRHSADRPPELEPDRGHRRRHERPRRHHGPPPATGLNQTSGRSRCPGR